MYAVPITIASLAFIAATPARSNPSELDWMTRKTEYVTQHTPVAEFNHAVTQASPGR